MEVASRELRNNTRSLLERVEGGEEVTITVNGKAIAVLRPVGRRTSWMARDEFARTVLAQQADPGLARDLALLAPDSTEDLSLS
jgi:prevent-host-death family protein